MNKKIYLYIKNRTGQAAIEIALTIPLLFFLIFGIFDVGKMMIAISDVTYTARLASNKASVSTRFEGEKEGLLNLYKTKFSGNEPQVKCDARNIGPGKPVCCNAVLKVPILYGPVFGLSAGSKSYITIQRRICTLQEDMKK